MSTGSRFVLPYQTVIDNAGVPIPGALLFFYASGTSTPLNTYSNPGLTVANDNPVRANGAGVFPNIFMTGAAYKVVLTDSLENEIWTADPVEGLGVSAGLEGYFFDTTADLLAAFGAAVVLPNSTQANTVGRTAVGDRGGAVFYYYAADTMTADNGGSVRVDAQGRRWYALDAFINRRVTPLLFGAKADGVTDDFSAMQAASTFVGAIGGGQVFFPAGHYRSLVNGNSIRMQNFCEYVGEGYSSHLDFAWNCFIGYPGGIFDGLYITLGYYAAHDIAAGSQILTATTPANAANFAVGDMVMAVSTAFNAGTVPYFVEINRVTAVDAATGVITLEDPIDDAWTGVKLANVTQYMVQNFRVANMRLQADYTQGSGPVKTNGSYKSVVEDCWMSSANAVTENAMVRSVFRNNIITWIYNTPLSTPVMDIETGSVRALVENCTVYLYNADGTTPGNLQIGIFGEWSRRTTIRGCRFVAPESTVAFAFQFPSGGGHQMHDIELNAKVIDQILRYGVEPNLRTLNPTIANLPAIFTNIRVYATDHINGSIALSGEPTDPAMKNIHIDGFYVTTPSVTDFSITLTSLADCTIRNVYTPGQLQVASTPEYTFNNVLISDSVIGPPDVIYAVNGITFEAIRRASTLPSPQFATFLTSIITTANNPIVTYTMPANQKNGALDHIDVDAYLVKTGSNGIATYEVHAFGQTVFTVNTAAAAAVFELHCRIFLTKAMDAFGYLTTPTNWTAVGHYILNDTLTHINTTNTYDDTIINTVQLQGWLANAGDNIQAVSACARFVGANYGQ